MSFILEVNNKGKDIILFNNHKYRETYAVKNGDIVWRCLGRICKASIRTNGEKTAIYTSKDIHTGQHPVTMRGLASTPPGQRRDSSSASGLVDDSSNEPELCSSTPATLSSSKDSSITEDESQYSYQIPPTNLNLLEENKILKDELDRLRVERQMILDHSAESDQRLLQYTNNVFLPPSSNTLLQQDVLPTQENKYTQTVEYAGMSASHDRHCAVCSIYKEEAKRMLESLRCMEEENKNLRELTSRQKSGDLNRSVSPSTKSIEATSLGNDGSSFIKGIQPTSPDIGGHVLQVQAQVLRPDSPSLVEKMLPLAMHTGQKLKKKRVAILADSQGRDMHRYMRELGDDFDVCVYVKPGAKLKHIVRDGLVYIKDFSDEDYVIILAGTNDVHKNEPAQLTIPQGMRTLLSLKHRTNILINSIPYRFDDHTLNDKIFFTNGIIERLAKDYKGVLNVSFGDVNAILQRSYLTRHGLHYSQNGKKMLGRRFVRFVESCSEKKIHVPPRTAFPGFRVELNPERSSRESGRLLPRLARPALHNLSLIEPYPDLSPSSEMSACAEGKTLHWSAMDSALTPYSSSLAEFPPLAAPTCLQTDCLLGDKRRLDLTKKVDIVENRTFLGKPPGTLIVK